MSNSREQGFEVLRVGGQVFAKDLYRKYRQRLRDRGMAERTREDVFGALRDFDAIFAQRLKLTPQGNVTYEGRSGAQRYRSRVGAAGYNQACRGQAPAIADCARRHGRGNSAPANLPRQAPHPWRSRRAFGRYNNLYGAQGAPGGKSLTFRAVGKTAPAMLQMNMESALSGDGRGAPQ